MKNLNNLETISLCENGKLVYTPGWMVLHSTDYYYHSSFLLPKIPQNKVSENSFNSEKFVVNHKPGGLYFLMRAMLKENVVDVPKEVTVVDGDSIIIPAHKKNILSWDFESKEPKRLVLIFSPDYSISVSKDLHILLDGEMKDFYLSGKYQKMLLVSVPNDGRILLKNKHFYISPVNFDF